MPWEARAGTDNRYYTRSTRVDGKIVREYFGNGAKAREAARQDQLAEEARAARTIERDRTKAWLTECERVCDELYELVDIVFRAEMVAAGYHYHRGEWRKRRLPKENRQAEESRQPDRNIPEATRGGGNRSGERRPAKARRRPMPAREPFQFHSGLVRGRNVIGGRPRRNDDSSAFRVRPGDQLWDLPQRKLNIQPGLRCAGSDLRLRRARPPPV